MLSCLTLVMRCFLNARVILHDLNVAPPALPILANSLCLDESGTAWRPHGGGFLRTLKDLQVQAGSSVRGDVTVHKPTAGVVGLESDDNVCSGVGHDDISSGRIIAGKFRVFGTCTLDIIGIEFLIGLVHDGEVVAVEMNLRIGELIRSLRSFYAGIS